MTPVWKPCPQTAASTARLLHSRPGGGCRLPTASASPRTASLRLWLPAVRTTEGPASTLGSSEIGSDKVILLHNKAHGEAEKTEGKTITEVPTAQESDRRGVMYGPLFNFGDKHYSSFSQTNTLIKLSDNLRCSTHRRCLRYRVSTSVHSLPLCDISSKSSTHETNLITPNSWRPPL